MPAAPAAPPPAAPAAKPAPSPAPPAEPSPSSAAPINFDADIDADLASLDDAKPKEAPKAPEKPVETPKVKEPEKPVETPKTEEKPIRPVKAADLRGAYEGLKKKVAEEYQPTIQRLEAKLKELEAAHKDDPANKQRLEAAQKRVEELESEIKFVNYKKSSEFKDKYEKPYQEAWDIAVRQISQLQVSTEGGEPRAATASDILALANLPLGELDAKAEELFGRSAPRVIRHIEKIRELSDAQHKALEEAQKSAGDREKQLTEQQQQAKQQVIKLWQGANDELAKKYPAWFSKDEADAEGNTLLEKGFSLADLHFVGPADLTPDQVELLPPAFRDALKARGSLTVQERVRLDALLRNKIASHDRLAMRLKKANGRIKELEASLKQYEESEPPAGKAGGRPPAVETDPMQEAFAEIDSFDRKNA